MGGGHRDGRGDDDRGIEHVAEPDQNEERDHEFPRSRCQQEMPMRPCRHGRIDVRRGRKGGRIRPEPRSDGSALKWWRGRGRSSLLWRTGHLDSSLRGVWRPGRRRPVAHHLSGIERCEHRVVADVPIPEPDGGGIGLVHRLGHLTLDEGRHPGHDPEDGHADRDQSGGDACRDGQKVPEEDGPTVQPAGAHRKVDRDAADGCSENGGYLSVIRNR